MAGLSFTLHVRKMNGKPRDEALVIPAALVETRERSVHALTDGGSEEATPPLFSPAVRFLGDGISVTGVERRGDSYHYQEWWLEPEGVAVPAPAPGLTPAAFGRPEPEPEEEHDDYEDDLGLDLDFDLDAPMGAETDLVIEATGRYAVDKAALAEAAALATLRGGAMAPAPLPQPAPMPEPEPEPVFAPEPKPVFAPEPEPAFEPVAALEPTDEPFADFMEETADDLEPAAGEPFELELPETPELGEDTGSFSPLRVIAPEPPGPVPDPAPEPVFAPEPEPEPEPAERDWTQVDWDESMSVGVEALDQDHLKLLILYNQTCVAQVEDEGDTERVIGKVLDGLGEYAASHFPREEKVQKLVGFPGAAVHHELHRHMVRSLTSLYGQFSNDPMSVSLATVHDLIRKWFFDHVLKEDMAYSLFAAGDPAAEAVARGEDPPGPEAEDAGPGGPAPDPFVETGTDAVDQGAGADLDGVGPMEWTPAMSVGVETVDEDHRVLVSLINQIRDVRHHDPEEEVAVIGSVLASLVDYTDYHFEREEAILKAVGYPRLDEHHRIHAGLRHMVADYSHHYQVDPTAVDLDELFRFLRHWLTDHIMKEDMDYAPYAAGNPAAEAAAHTVAFTDDGAEEEDLLLSLSRSPAEPVAPVEADPGLDDDYGEETMTISLDTEPKPPFGAGDDDILGDFFEHDSEATFGPGDVKK